MTRHQRRKAAKARNWDKTVRLAIADRAEQIQATVLSNLSSPRQRNYYGGTISRAYSGETSARYTGR